MKRTIKKILAVLACLALVVAVIVLDPMLYLRSSYVATPFEKLADSKPAAWQLGMTARQMCRAVEGGDSLEYRGLSHKNYGHIDEFFERRADGTSETVTIICSFIDTHSTRYQRWDWRQTGYQDIEIIWHGRRQRGDVNVPDTLF